MVKLVLNAQKVIRGKKYPAGTVLLTGECERGFSPDEVNLAIQLAKIRVEEVAKKAEQKK